MQANDSCPCSGKNLAKLIHPAALTLLSREDQHGYEILQRLGNLRLFHGTKPDARGLYRTLQCMENSGHVTSRWVPSDSGPARRLYQITEGGMACLRRWIDTLHDYRLALDELLNMAEDVACLGIQESGPSVRSNP